MRGQGAVIFFANAQILAFHELLLHDSGSESFPVLHLRSLKDVHLDGCVLSRHRNGGYGLLL